MLILELRKAITLALRSRFHPLEAHIKEHPRSRFVVADLEESLRNTYLALRVAYLGVLEDPSEEQLTVTLPMTWAIFIVAKDGRKDEKSRDVSILNVAPTIIELVKANTWDVPDDSGAVLSKPERIRFVPAYQGDEDATASKAVWAVTWKQTLSFDALDDGSDGLRPLLELITRYDIAPADDVIEGEDEIQLPQ
jgi:hypothetical protein